MPADPTIQNALVVIAIALSVQTVVMLCTVIAIVGVLKRTHAMVDDHLNRVGERLDDMARQTRLALTALERSSTQVNTMIDDAGQVLRGVGTFMGAPRALLFSGVASAASALSRWRRSRQQQHHHAAAR